METAAERLPVAHFGAEHHLGVVVVLQRHAHVARAAG
jgi:hypothetical protein